jgi:hypothetical protein
MLPLSNKPWEPNETQPRSNRAILRKLRSLLKLSLRLCGFTHIHTYISVIASNPQHPWRCSSEEAK